MKLTSEDFMQWLGLQVGDRVKLNDDIWTVIYDANEIHTVYLQIKDGELYYTRWLFELIDKNFEIIPKIKRVGDLKCCDEIKCEQCPLRGICTTAMSFLSMKLYDTLDRYGVHKGTYFDQEIYDLLKARLDKEVEENE